MTVVEFAEPEFIRDLAVPRLTDSVKLVRLDGRQFPGRGPPKPDPQGSHGST